MTYIFADQTPGPVADAKRDAVTERAIEIAETFDVCWEIACQRSEAERDALDEMDAPSDWDAGSVTFDPYVG